MYRFLKVFIFLLDAEFAHYLGMIVVRIIGFLHRLKIWSRPSWAASPELKTLTPFGEVDSPLGLAAGLDKNAQGLWGWQALGFAFVEVGTATPLPQPGNDYPRLFRFPMLQALVNRLGFNNIGAMEIAENIRQARLQGLKIKIGGNIGKNKITPAAQTPNDYKKAAMYLHPHVDYLVINVSSPNTPGLRDMQEEVMLEKIVEAVRRETPDKPLFIKLAPDNAERFSEGVMNIFKKYNIQGLICGNTLANHAISEDLTEAEVVKLPQGGLSGSPIFDINLNLARHYLQQFPKPFVIGVGGITEPNRALSYLSEGCSLIQIYTGLIYQGPNFIKKILTSIMQSRKN